MKKAVIFSLVLLMAAISTQVEGKKRKPFQFPTLPPKMGWRFGNGLCICKGPRTSSAPGWNRIHQVHPTAGHHPSGPRHYPSGPHGPPGHHPSGPRHYPSGPHGPPGHHPSGPPGHHPSGPPRHHPSGPHGHHPTGPHGPQRHHPSQHHGHHPSRPQHHGHRHGPSLIPPTRRPIDNKHRNHGMKKRQRGPHNHGPTRKQPMKIWKKCVCGKPAVKGFKIKFRMMKNWRPEMANRKSVAYRQLSYKIIKKVAIVLKTGAKNIYNMRFTQGSIVAEFEVKKSDMTKDPEKALRHAIHKGQLSDLEIQPESLAVHQSYSGVKLSEWKTDEDECHRCGSVTQTRECIEVIASCDGIPLTRNASCYEACPRARVSDCGGYRGYRMAKVMIIACLIIVGVIVIVTILVVTKVKRNRRKYLKTSPSTSSIKQLKDDDKLQSKC